nr:hypothetical protein [Lachnospiraceae bacterium]
MSILGVFLIVLIFLIFAGGVIIVCLDECVVWVLQGHGKCLKRGKRKIIKRWKNLGYSQEEIERTINSICDFANEVINEYEKNIKFHIRYNKKDLNAEACKNRVFLNWKWIEKYLKDRECIDKIELIIRHEIGHIINDDKIILRITATDRVYLMAREVLADNVAKRGFSKGKEDAVRVFIEKTEDVGRDNNFSKSDLWLQRYMSSHPSDDIRIKMFERYDDISEEDVVEIVEILKKEYGLKRVKIEKVLKKLQNLSKLQV